MEYILSFDVGTSAIKAALVSREGEIAAVSVETYSLIIPQPGWAEQVPQEYWRAACVSARRAIHDAGVAPREIKGIVFATQWKGVIPVDQDGQVLHNAIIWLDARAGVQAERLNSAMGCFVGSDNQYWPRLMWLKENMPDIYDRSELLLGVDSYLKFRATGIATSDATNSFTRAEDPELQAFYDRILEVDNLDADKLPPMTSATAEAGRITEQAAEEMGICVGTPVFGGSGDIPAVAIGAGCVGYGKEHMYLGSSGWIGRVDQRSMPLQGVLYEVIENNRMLSISGMQSVCMTQDWAIKTLYHAERAAMEDRIFDLLDQETAIVPPCADNLLATPWLYGETPPLSRDAHVVFLNLQPHHTRAHMVTAIRESIACHLRMCKEQLDGPGSGGTAMHIVGGGAKSDQWMQAFADILGIPVEVPVNAQHAGAAGAAACAAVGMGWWGNLADADNNIRIERTFVPRPEFSARYEHLYHTFLKVFPALREIFESLRPEN